VIDQHMPKGSPPRLVKATYEEMAVRHVSRERYIAHIPKKDELEHWLTSGVKIEYAEGTAQAQLPLQQQAAATA
jgi:hypothetical protein